MELRRDSASSVGSSPVPSRDSLGIDEEDSLESIRKLISAGRMQDAQQSVQQYLVRHPKDAEALVLAAQTVHAAGNVDRAIALLDEASGYDGQHAENLKARAAELLVEAQRWDEATARFERLVQEHPEFDAARHRLAGLLNARGFRFDANEHIRQLCRRSGATAEELRGLIAPSRTFITFAEKPDIGDSDLIEKSGVLSVTLALSGAGDRRDALQVLQQSDLIEQKNPCAFALYGQLLIEAQQYDAFQDWLQQVEPASERYPAYWMALGDWAMYQQAYAVAVRMYAEAVLREPGDAAANNRLTQSLRAVGDDEAVAGFEHRNAQIDYMTQIAKEIFSDPNAGPDAITQLTDLLAKAGRPLEALAWHRLLLEGINASGEAMQRLEAEKLKVTQAERDRPEYLRGILLCGLQLDRFPLDRSWIEQSRATTRERVVNSASDQREAIPPVFVNVASAVGLDFTYRNAAEPVEREFRIFQAYGGGVGCLDYDCDGNVDFYLGQGAGEPPDGLGVDSNRLSRNLGDRFQDVTTAAVCDDRGYTCGVTAGDWNQDGFPDLLIGNIQRNSLLINQGDGTFKPHPGDSMWSVAKYTTGVAIADVTGDRLPDIIEVNYLDDSRIYDPIRYKPDGTPVVLPGPLHFQPSVDRVFVSQGDGSFRGEILGAEEGSSAATGLGLLVADIDRSGANSIFVANDLMANQWWHRAIGKSEPAWQDVAVVRGVAYGPGGMPLACMGIAAADYDENGRLDLHITNFADQWSNQYMQGTDGTFVDRTLPTGLDRDSLKMLGFGTQALDYDNNSTIDLVVGNGHIEDFRAKGIAFEMPTQLFAWQGGKFVLMPVAGDSQYWERGHLSRALAKCDWNNDGSIDFIVTDLKHPVSLLENRTESPHHWLQLELVGTTCERDAIGAVAEVTAGGRTLMAMLQTGDGYMCKNQSLLAFGLGDRQTIEELTIHWPDGSQQTWSGIEANQRWLIVQGESLPMSRKQD